METNKGVIKVDIAVEDAPKTSANFLDLVKKGYYNGLTFHRYEPNFCIQGGDKAGTGSGPGYMENGHERTIRLEVNPKLKHDQAGVIAMARTNDPNSASTQFYFTLGPCDFLDMKYAVFGKVADQASLAVVKELRKDDKMTKVYMQK
jgi:cyclophilin family peptidyl-prolyl cis-trans isomerase